MPTPQWNRIPFLCHLTFTASGHEQGDIVQVCNHFYNETFPQHHRHRHTKLEMERRMEKKVLSENFPFHFRDEQFFLLLQKVLQMFAKICYSFSRFYDE